MTLSWLSIVRLGLVQLALGAIVVLGGGGPQRLTHGLLLGWRQQSGQFVFPAGQLDALNRPAQGMEGVLSNLSDPQVAWLWLHQPTALLRGQTPIELLKPDDTGQTSTEQIERVVEAASAKALGAFE